MDKPPSGWTSFKAQVVREEGGNESLLKWVNFDVTLACIVSCITFSPLCVIFVAITSLDFLLCIVDVFKKNVSSKMVLA